MMVGMHRLSNLQALYRLESLTVYLYDNTYIYVCCSYNAGIRGRKEGAEESLGTNRRRQRVNSNAFLRSITSAQDENAPKLSGEAAIFCIFIVSFSAAVGESSTDCLQIEFYQP